MNKKCQGCGALVEDSAKFCTNCGGTDLIEEAPQVTTEQVQAQAVPNDAPQATSYGYTDPNQNLAPTPQKKSGWSKILLGVIAGIAVIAIAAAAVLTFVGGTEESKFYGKWSCKFDITDQLNEAFAETPEIADYIKIDEFYATINLEFNKDGTYKMAHDRDQAKEVLSAYETALKDGLTNWLNDYIVSTIEEYELGISVEEFMELSGIDIDEMLAEAFDEEEMLEYFADLDSEGNFKAEEGKLYLSDGLDYDIDPEVYDNYEFNGKDEFALSSDDDDFGFIMTFKKVG